MTVDIPSEARVRSRQLPRARRAITLLVAAICLVGLAPVTPAVAASPVPPGYRLVATESLAPGVEHQTLHQDQPAQTVHVARLAAGMAGRLLPVLAHDVLTGPTSGREPTSAMCSRVRCVAAVNGDFFDPAGQTIGAMVSGGELVATPGIEHILLRVDGQGRPTLRPGLQWRVAVTTADGATLPVTAVNRPLSGEGITLYSRRWGPSTATDAGATEVLLRLPRTSNSLLPSGPSAVVVGPSQAGGNLPIPAGHVVLSARGAGAIALAAMSRRALGIGVLDVAMEGIVSAIGGSPKLLENGKLAYPVDNPDGFTQDRHPRTVVGITPGGEMLLVTADGRGVSAGLTLLEAARLLAGLGAVEAMNLDGGGSTTFVTAGSVRNVPSGGSERAVASSLAVMAAPPDPLATLLKQVTDSVSGLLQPAP
ncbi:MAG TPA: phosphodiester glycosidase family protein [Acidimicrobiales bacterium]|nr:phosphodiester glycosidase family protein [Acidimicrobiales bacterium]